MLVFEKVIKNFGAVRAIRDVSLRLDPGRIHSIIGPNGAGKSTLVNLAAGSFAVTSGFIRLGDVELSRLPKNEIFGAGVVRTYQNIRLFDNMTVRENLEVAFYRGQIGQALKEIFLPGPSRRLKGERVAASRRTLRLLGLLAYEDMHAGELSYGLQKRLEIARALVSNPAVLLLDEPAAGLNHTESAELKDIIRSLRTPERIIVIVEHDMDLVMSLSDHIVVLHHGEFLFEGPPKDVSDSELVQEAYLGRREDVAELRAAFEARRRKLGLRGGGRPQRH